MTILPKKKSSQPKSDRDSSGSVDNFTNRGLPQNQVSFFFIIPTTHFWLSPPPYLVELEKKFIMADTLFTLVSTWTLIQPYFIMRIILDRLQVQNWTFEDFFWSWTLCVLTFNPRNDLGLHSQLHNAFK